MDITLGVRDNLVAGPPRDPIDLERAAQINAYESGPEAPQRVARLDPRGAASSDPVPPACVSGARQLKLPPLDEQRAYLEAVRRRDRLRKGVQR